MEGNSVTRSALHFVPHLDDGRTLRVRPSLPELGFALAG